MVKNEETRFQPIKVLSGRLYDLKQRRNLAAVLTVFLAATGYAVLFTMAKIQKEDFLAERLSMYLGMAVIFAAGSLIISCLFRISVIADMGIYRQLKVLGMTSRQIRKLIYGQANRICVIGIPLGLVWGWMLGMGTPLLLAGSAVLAWATVWAGCLYPAYLAGSVSLGEARGMDKQAWKSGHTKEHNREEIPLNVEFKTMEKFRC